MKVYVVRGIGGQYEEYYNIILNVFKSKDDAQAFADRFMNIPGTKDYHGFEKLRDFDRACVEEYALL